MEPPLDELFRHFATGKLVQMSSRIVDCLDRLTDDQIWSRGSENENAIGNLVLHLCGNVRQWILGGVAGRADVRDRPAEFAARGDATGAELAARLESVVREAIEIVKSVSAARLAERISVQGYNVSVLEAIGHVTEHFSHHTGQIIFATKLLTASDLGYYKHLNRPQHKEAIP
jgi:uncharacterized damage-inducible protein DinB